MYIFVIDAENRVTAHAATKPFTVPKGEYKFADLEELARLAAGWPGARLVEIWNKLPGTRTVLRFADRKGAIQRIWKVVEDLEPSRAEQKGRTVPRTRAKVDTANARDGTKSERIIALLRRPSGATITDIMAETGWQAHSVRGFISGQLSRRLGLRVKSFKHDGERIYRIVKGETA
jgi:hypothetical protein